MFNSVYITAAHEPGARLRRMQVSGRDEDGQACSFSPAHTFLSISHTRSTQVGAWRAWYPPSQEEKNKSNQDVLPKASSQNAGSHFGGTSRVTCSGADELSHGAPYCDHALRTTLLGDLSAGPLLSRASLLHPGPLCSGASAPALSLLSLAAPTCSSPSLVPLTK